MPRHDNFSAWITIEGVETEEYQVEKDENKVTCWIASEENKARQLATAPPYFSPSPLRPLRYTSSFMAPRFLSQQPPMLMVPHTPGSSFAAFHISSMNSPA